MSSKFLVTQSLLSDFAWIFKKEDGYADFLRTLRREPKEQSKAMFAGIAFEEAVTAYANGDPLNESRKHADAIREVGDECRGGQFQVRLSREIEVGGVQFLAYGVLDCLKAGTIYDIKFSKTYTVGKYRDSPQHPMYFYICPEAQEFVYLISDGEGVCRERYAPDITEPIEYHIGCLMKFLDRHELVDEYAANWQAQ
jgi:hypothetical protein